MLEPNRLNPPPAFHAITACEPGTVPGQQVFVAADDYDTTGILAGCDPCASLYWWMPELHAAAPADLLVTAGPGGISAARAVNGPVQAARRGSSLPQAAA